MAPPVFGARIVAISPWTSRVLAPIMIAVLLVQSARLRERSPRGSTVRQIKGNA